MTITQTRNFVAQSSVIQGLGNHFSTGGSKSKSSRSQQNGSMAELTHCPPILIQVSRDVAQLTTCHIIYVTLYVNVTIYMMYVCECRRVVCNVLKLDRWSLPLL